MTAPAGWSYFDDRLAAPVEDIEFRLSGLPSLPWASFLLNPRRLRGSDFLMRWSQGVWSERRIVEAVNATDEFLAVPYGPSSVAPENDPRAHELYFERLEAAGRGNIKRPDLLIFRMEERKEAMATVARIGGAEELPFHDEDEHDMRRLLRLAIVAIECENSLWMAKQMPSYGETLRPMRRLGGLPGLPKNAVLPNIFLKEEDRGRLLAWEGSAKVPIDIWQVFHDIAFGISLRRAERLIQSGHIDPRRQTFQAPGGATSSKIVYRIHHHYTYDVGEMAEPAHLVADRLIDQNGHILPWVRFEGGRLVLASGIASRLRRMAGTHTADHPA